MSGDRSRLYKGLELASAVLVALAVLLLPVTSQPQLSRLMGHALVAPPAIVVVALLGVCWLPVFLIKGGGLPAETRPFLAFLLMASSPPWRPIS